MEVFLHSKVKNKTKKTHPDFPILKGSYLMILASPEEQAEKLSTGDSKAIAGTM